jgi:hypothetical protein
MRKARVALLSVVALTLLSTLSPPIAAGNDQGNGTPSTKLAAPAQPKDVSFTKGRERTGLPGAPAQSVSFSRRGRPTPFIDDAFRNSTWELPTHPDWRIESAMAFNGTFAVGRGSSPIGATRHADSSMECLPR